MHLSLKIYDLENKNAKFHLTFIRLLITFTPLTFFFTVQDAFLKNKKDSFFQVIKNLASLKEFLFFFLE
jgi:hypothetical protein